MTDARLSDLDNSTVFVFDLSTRTGYGEPSYSTGGKFNASVKETSKLVTDSDGQEVVATHVVRIFSTGASSITPESVIRLGSDSTSVRRKVVSVDRPNSPTGRLTHTRLTLG